MPSISSFLNFFLIFSLFPITSNSFRVLMMSSNVGYSHLEFTGKLTDILIDAGHEVDYFIEVYNRDLKHNGTKKANVIRYEGKNLDKIEESQKNSPAWGNSFEATWSIDSQVEFYKLNTFICQDILTDHKMLTYLKSRNYSVAFAEFFDHCSWFLFKLLKIKSVHEMSAVALTENTYDVHGGHFDFRRVPIFHNYKYAGPVNSFLELLYNFYMYLNARYSTVSSDYSLTHKVLKDLIDPNHPSVAELQRKSSYIWVNSHEMIDFARANSPKVKSIGGITINRNPPKLNRETAKIFQKAKKGVVLVSFGSIVNTDHMKPKLRDEMLQAFSQFPDHEFIWKLTSVNENITKIISQYPNVHVFSWLQQASILAHSKTVGFITHMGLNSLNEAIHYGVAVVGVPFFGDQYVNMAMARNRGVGVYLNRKSITTKSMASALNEILNNQKYRNRALELKAKIANFPTNQTEMFIKHVEFAEKFGSLEELKLNSAGASIIELFNLDLIGLALFILFIVFYLTLYLLKKFLKMLKLLRMLRLFNDQFSSVSTTKKID